MLVSRTGVTGEYGYKLHVPVEQSAAVRNQLVAAGATPVGLAALRIARMEARFADLDTEVGTAPLTPFDLGIQWMVSFDDHEFVGRVGLLVTGSPTRPSARLLARGGPGRSRARCEGLHRRRPGRRGRLRPHSPRLNAVIGTARLQVERRRRRSRVAGRERRVPGQTTSAPFLIPTSFGVTLE